MVRYNNNRGVGIIGGGRVGEIEISRFQYLLHIYVNSDVTDTFIFERNYVYYHLIFPKINKKSAGDGKLE